MAVYWPVYDIWHSAEGMQQQLTVHDAGWLNDSACGRAAAWLVEKGYGFDFISDRQLLADRAWPYSVVLVPRTEHVPLATLRKLLETADSGKPVLFLDDLPSDVPGFHRFAERRMELKKLVQEHKDLVVSMTALEETLAETKAVREAMVDAGLDFVRRRHDQGYHYFVANMGDKAVNGWVTLGTPFKSAVILDAHTARTGLATMRNGRELFLQIHPGETRIIRTFRSRAVDGPRWPVLNEINDMAFDVTGEWNVTFINGGPELPAAFTTSELTSWTELAENAAKCFAGTARYAIAFDLPETHADDWIINLGEVRESARVIINGKEAAALYSVPFRAHVGPFLKHGRNRLEIEVTNLSANRIRDLDIRKVEWKIFHDINFVDHNYTEFDAAKWPLTPSGLLGPVSLIPAKARVP